MAHKSKTQRAKATAAKANRRDREERDAIAAENAPAAEATEEKKGGLFKAKSDKSDYIETHEIPPLIPINSFMQSMHLLYMKDSHMSYKIIASL